MKSKPYFIIISILFFSFSVFSKEYYVSKSGSNSNPGTKEEPFLSIQKAAIYTTDGDVCIIEEGTYYEQIRPYHNGSTFKAAPGAKVVISMYEEKNEWAEYQDGIYVTSIGKNLNDENQVIYDGQIMNLARWPNKTNSNPFDLEAYKAWGTNSSLSHDSIPAFDWGNGGVLFFLGKNRWTSWRVPIKGAEAGKITFEELPTGCFYAGEHSPTNGGEFYLSNILEALDAPGEWYIDRSKMKLYFKPPEGGSPLPGKTLVRRFNQAINLSNMKEVTIEGVTFYGGQVNLKSSYRCVIQNCQILYGNHTIASNSSYLVPQTSIDLDNGSRENVIRYNTIQWGAGNGIIVMGTNNRVENNYIGNFNYLGCYAAPVELFGTKNQLVYNEIFNGGRDNIRGGGNGCEVGYNNIHHSNLINDDCGGIYFCCETFGYTRIHHNWIHDITSRDENFEKYKGCGVYLDNTTKNVIVDHNVMWNLEWTGIQINWAGENLLIYNNTIWCKSSANSKPMGRWVNGYEITNIPVYNTLTNKSELHYTNLQATCTLALNDNPFEDFANKDFRPKAGTCPVDGGIEIPDYTNGFAGSDPDIGAYESGQDPWVAGPEWEPAELEKDSVSLKLIQSVQMFLPSLTYQTHYQATTSGTLKLLLLNGSDEVITESSSKVFAGRGTKKLTLNLDPLPNAGFYKLKLTFVAEGQSKAVEDLHILEFTSPVVATEVIFLDSDDRIERLQSKFLNTKILPEDTYDKTLKWTSSNPEVIEVNPTTGELTAIIIGEATITAETNNGITASYLLKVVQKAGESLPWIEEFTLPNDTKIDMSSTSWTIETRNEGIGSFAAVNSNQLVVRNLECTFRSGIIDLYKVKSAKLEVDVKGDFRARNSELDSLRIYYMIDSVEHLAAEFSDRFKKTTVTVDDIRGNFLQIVIEAKTAYATEIYYIDNISVTENLDASSKIIKSFSEFKAYPNPNRGNNITIAHNLNNKVNLSINDLQGRCIYKESLEDKITMINNVDLQDGMYVVCLEQNGLQISKLLIIK